MNGWNPSPRCFDFRLINRSEWPAILFAQPIAREQTRGVVPGGFPAGKTETRNSRFGKVQSPLFSRTGVTNTPPGYPFGTLAG